MENNASASAAPPAARVHQLWRGNKSICVLYILSLGRDRQRLAQRTGGISAYVTFLFFPCRTIYPELKQGKNDPFNPMEEIALKLYTEPVVF